MKNRDVNTDNIYNAVNNLNKLKKDAEDFIGKQSKPEGKKEKGKVESEIKMMCDLLAEEWKSFLMLVEVTSNFLDRMAKTYDDTDSQNANKID